MKKIELIAICCVFLLIFLFLSLAIYSSNQEVTKKYLITYISQNNGSTKFKYHNVIISRTGKEKDILIKNYEDFEWMRNKIAKDTNSDKVSILFIKELPF
jgi:hypothetical protein